MVDYEQWVMDLCTLLDNIEFSETLDEVKDLTHQRFEIAKNNGATISFTGLRVSELRN